MVSEGMLRLERLRWIVIHSMCAKILHKYYKYIFLKINHIIVLLLFYYVESIQNLTTWDYLNKSRYTVEYCLRMPYKVLLPFTGSHSLLDRP